MRRLFDSLHSLGFQFKRRVGTEVTFSKDDIRVLWKEDADFVYVFRVGTALRSCNPHVPLNDLGSGIRAAISDVCPDPTEIKYPNETNRWWYTQGRVPVYDPAPYQPCWAGTMRRRINHCADTGVGIDALMNELHALRDKSDFSTRDRIDEKLEELRKVSVSQPKK